MSSLDAFGLDEPSKKEISEFIKQQEAFQRMQSATSEYTSICWDKCITGTPSTHFSRGEQTCLTNCVERFLDSSIFIVRQIQRQRDAMQASTSPSPSS